MNSYDYFVSNDFTQDVNFPYQIPDFDSHSPVIVYLFLSDPNNCSAGAFPPFGNSGTFYVSVSIDLPSNSKGDAAFHCTTVDYSYLTTFILI